MKRILLLSLTLIFAFCGALYAAGVNGQFDGYDIVRVQYEGKELKADAVPGILYKGNTLVPLGLLRKAGFNVEWSKDTLTANVTTKKAETVNKKLITMDEVKAFSNAVAYIEVLNDNGVAYRQGSGFIINSKGLLITNYHVAEEGGKLHAMKVEVNGKAYNVPAGKYLFADQEKDVYGVYLDGEGDFPFLKVNTEIPEKGDIVYAIGNPEGKRNVVSEGKVGYLIDRDDVTYIASNADIEGGQSGGALINQYGEVIGITSKGDDYDYDWSIVIKYTKELYEKSFNE